MPNVTVKARISPELKEQAKAILSEIGLSTADAIRVFLQQTVNSVAYHFSRWPNVQTLKR